MKNLLLVLILLSFLFIQLSVSTIEYKEYAEKWYSELSKEFNKEQKRFIIEQLSIINQGFLVLQEMVLNKINEDYYTKTEDESKTSVDIINSLKKESEKPFLQKLKSLYKVYN